MSFLYPAFLIGALAVGIPLILHLLRRDVAPEVPFTAVRLLRRSPVDRSRRRRLRDLLLLAARVAAVLLLAAAFARPYSPSAAVTVTRIVAVDRSASMGPPQRFARARDLARAAVDEAGAGEAVALIAFDDRAQVLAEPGGAGAARAAVDRIEPGFGGTDYGAAVDAAVEAAAGRPGHLVLVTDLQRSGWANASARRLPPGWRVHVRDIGAAPENAALVNVAVEADRVIATIRNSGGAAREGEVHVRLDGSTPSGPARYAVGPGEVVDLPIAGRTPDEGVLSVSIEDPGGIQADDTRHVILAARAASKVLVVTGATASRQRGFYLSRALEVSQGLDDPFDASVESGAALARPVEDLRAAFVAVALLSTRSLDRRGREALAAYVRDGGGLLVAASPEVEPSALSGLMEWDPPLTPVELDAGALQLAATDLRHPIFRPFAPLAANLGQVRFDRVWRVRPEGWQVVARFTDGSPALLERGEGKGRVLLFASDLDRRWNDFPLHPAFVPFAIEALRHAAQDRRLPREFTVGGAPPGAERRPGTFTVGSPPRTVVVNVDPRESAAERLTVDEFLEMVPPDPDVAAPAPELQASETEAGQSYWRYALVIMLAALVAESFVGRPS